MPWLKIHLLEGMEGVKCNPRTIIIEPVEDALCPVTFLMCLLTAALAMHKDTPWQQVVAKKITNDQSPVFRNTKNDNHLAAQSVSWVVRTVASNAGLTANYSGHSLRIGGACAAAIAGLGLEAIRAIGGWTSDAVFLYVRSYVPASMGASTKMGFKFDSKTGAAAHRRLLLR